MKGKNIMETIKGLTHEEVEVKIKPAAKSKIRRHLCPNKKALSDQGLL